MPTRGELQRPTCFNHLLSQESTHSWTDDVPVCPLSGVGFSTNQIYRKDGTPSEQHEFEDKSFHFWIDIRSIYFYGLFDGHCGKKAAYFAAQRMPAEVLLDQLKDVETEKHIKEILRQAFFAVERGFFESIDDLLLEKAKLEFQLQEAKRETFQKHNEINDCLHAITAEISGGSTAVVALVINDKLYVANVGNSRAVLCKLDQNNVLNVLQLSTDHDINNEDELLRLSELGLDVEKIRKKGKLGNQENTRCIGNYVVKAGYKDFDDVLRDATREPVIAEPEICGGITIDENCKFLLLMSDGLYKSLEEATGTKQANIDIVNLVIEQFAIQSTLTGVAQAVVDKVVRIHHDRYMSGTESAASCQKRDDITLLVRNFNQPLPNSFQNSLSASQSLNSTYQSIEQKQILETKRMSGVIITGRPDTFSNTPTMSEPSFHSETITSYTESGEKQMLFQSSHCHSLPLNEQGRINPYVDFTDFYKAVEEAKKTGSIIPKCCDV